MTCCGQAGTLADRQFLAAKYQPDLIILDLRLKGGDGMELIKILKAEHPALPIMILSQHTGALYVERALRAGSIGGCNSTLAWELPVQNILDKP